MLVKLPVAKETPVDVEKEYVFTAACAVELKKPTINTCLKVLNAFNLNFANKEFSRLVKTTFVVYVFIGCSLILSNKYRFLSNRGTT